MILLGVVLSTTGGMAELGTRGMETSLCTLIILSQLKKRIMAYVGSNSCHRKPKFVEDGFLW